MFESKLYPTLFFFFLHFLLTAQSTDSLKIGEWSGLYSYQTGKFATQNTDKVYFVTQFAIATMDKNDNSVEYLYKGKELNEINPVVAKYNQPNKVLVVTYENSSFDLVFENESIIFPNIKNNSGITGDKTIQNIHFEKDTFLYLSCSFGLVQFNLKKREFGFTTFTQNEKVYCSAVFNNEIYIGTEKGIYKADRYGTNLSDFRNWQLVHSIICRDMTLFNGALYFLKENVLFKKSADGNEQPVFYASDRVNTLSSDGSRILIFEFFKIATLDKSDNTTYITSNCIGKPGYGVEDNLGTVWVADLNSGFYKIDKSNVCTPLKFDSPFTHNTSDLLFSNDTLWAVSGGVLDNSSPRDDGSGFYFRDDKKQWFSYNSNNTPLIKDNYVFDFYKIAKHPSSQKMYFATYSRGLIEFDPSQNKLKQYTSNIPDGLTNTIGDVRVRVSGLAFDKDNNLWLSNYNAATPIVVWTKDGNWASFDAAPAKDLWQIAIDNYGYKWIGTGSGVLVYDSGKNLTDPSDDRYRLIESVPVYNGTSSIEKVNAVIRDRDGDIWLATSKGAIVFECGSNPFEASACRGSRKIVVVDGFAEYLLSTEDVRCVAVDGANRKWFGTTNGIFLQSADGQTQIARFTKDNSPLPDNGITAITIDQKSGIVYVATTQGMVSLKAEAIEGNAFNSDPIVYPNPVRPEYEGPIAIKGVATDANIIITDISGQLVYQGKAYGGQAVWDGKDFKGKKVVSGVYLIYCTGTDDPEVPNTITAKVTIVR